MKITIVKVDHYPIFNMLKIYHGCDIRKKSNGLNELINQANNEICISSMHLAYWKFHDTKKHKTSNKRYLTLHKMSLFHLISWCGSFVERHSFRIFSGESLETMRKLCLSTKFPHQEIRRNNDILCSVTHSFLKELKEKRLLFSYKCILYLDE